MRLWKSSIYRAHPLKLDKGTNIRLIELLPGAPETPVSCRLHVLALEHKPSFTALSYVWGDERCSQPIVLDGKPHVVRENLWNFLHEYRHSQTTTYLWIDALCIDQSSIKERNHQVALMGKIYSEAELVIAWLGHGFEDSLANVSNFTERTSDIHIYATSLMHLSTATYWTRLWIVQEFVLAKHLDIWSRDCCTDGNALVEAYMRYKQNPYGRLDNLKFDDFPVLDENFQRLKSLPIEAVLGSRHAYQQRLRGFGVQDIDRRLESSMLFGSFAFAGCADARDRVYGVLGLLNPLELNTHPIEPDYSKSRSELFREIFNRQVRLSRWANEQWESPMRFAHSLKQALELDEEDENVKLISKGLVKACNTHRPIPGISLQPGTVSWDNRFVSWKRGLGADHLPEWFHAHDRNEARRSFSWYMSNGTGSKMRLEDIEEESEMPRQDHGASRQPHHVANSAQFSSTNLLK